MKYANPTPSTDAEMKPCVDLAAKPTFTYRIAFRRTYVRGLFAGRTNFIWADAPWPIRTPGHLSAVAKAVQAGAGGPVEILDFQPA